MTLVSPSVAMTDPSACRATLPDSSVSVSPPHWIVFFVGSHAARHFKRRVAEQTFKTGVFFRL